MTAIKTLEHLKALLQIVGNANGIKDFSIISDTEVNMQHDFDSLEQAQKNVNYYSEMLTKKLGQSVKVSGVFNSNIVESNVNNS